LRIFRNIDKLRYNLLTSECISFGIHQISLEEGVRSQ